METFKLTDIPTAFKTLIKSGLLAFFLVLGLCALEAQLPEHVYVPDAHISARLDSNEMLVGDHMTLVISVEHGLKSRFLNAQPETILDSAAGFEVISDGGWQMGTTSASRKITFTVWDSGLYRIPPVLVTLESPSNVPNNVESAPILLEVKNPRGTEDMVGPDGIKDIVREPYWLSDAWPYILGALVYLGLILLIFQVSKRKKMYSAPKILPKPSEPPYTVAMRKLNALKATEAWQRRKVKIFYSELTYAVREYLENRFSVPALEITTDELLENLKKPLNNALNTTADDMALLENLLRTADWVKFAQGEPNSTQHRTFCENAILVVQNIEQQALLIEKTPEVSQ
jgi:hypothetical protein